jgi:hypothetical protein
MHNKAFMIIRFNINKNYQLYLSIHNSKQLYKNIFNQKIILSLYNKKLIPSLKIKRIITLLPNQQKIKIKNISLDLFI